MPLILPVNGVSPVWGNDCFIAENATIVGQVTMGDQCSVWFTAVVRGDVNTIEMGNKVNIQEVPLFTVPIRKPEPKLETT
jgi:carbonic anhydrase/acetyltransferase-like protein (isoleucine patch superfamily)